MLCVIMRIILLGFSIFFGVSFAAHAQTVAPEEPMAKNERSTDNADKNAKSSDSDEQVDDTIEIDAFFKRGEENAKKGMGCEIPPEPVA